MMATPEWRLVTKDVGNCRTKVGQMCGRPFTVDDFINLRRIAGLRGDTEMIKYCDETDPHEWVDMMNKKERGNHGL